MPYLQLDVSRRYPIEAKRSLALRLGNIYADVMQTTPDKVTVAFRELKRLPADLNRRDSQSVENARVFAH